MKRVQQVGQIDCRHRSRHDDNEFQKVAAVRAGEHLLDGILNEKDQESHQNEVMQQHKAGTADIYGGNGGEDEENQPFPFDYRKLSEK